MTVNVNPYRIPNLDLLFLFGSSLLRVSVDKSFPLRLFCSLGLTRESTFPKIRHSKMFKFKCKHVMHFIVIIIVVPLLVNVISNDIYTALLKHSSMLTRFVMITLALIVFGVVNRFFVEVHHSDDRVSLLPCRWPSSEPARSVQLREPLVLQVVSEPPVVPEPPVTGSLGPQVTGRPYSPLIYPQVRDIVDRYATSYVNERWGVEEVEFMTGRIHTKDPVPDVEAAMLSELTLTGSKVLLRRLEIGPQAGNIEIDQLSSEISEAMRRAREIDEDCTLQLGSFAMCKYTDGGLKCWRLQKEWIPTISCVWRSRNLLDLLKGQSAKWCVRGVNLQSATLKVSTTDESETLNVVHHYKKKNGEDVLLCEEPRLARHAAPKFQKAVYLYALNSVEIEEGVTFDVQSNPKDVPGAYWISVVRRLSNRPLMLIMMACIMTAVLIMNITHGRYGGLASKATSVSSHDHFQQYGNIINVGILSLFLHELPFFFLTFASLMLISIITSALRRAIKGRPSGDYVPCFGKVSALQEDASTPCPTSPATKHNVLEDVARSPLPLDENKRDSPLSSSHAYDTPQSPLPPAAAGTSKVPMVINAASPVTSPVTTPRSGSGSDDSPNPALPPVLLDSDGDAAAAATTNVPGGAGRARRPSNETSISGDTEVAKQKSLSVKRKFMPKYTVKQRASGTNPGIDGPPDDGYTWRKYGQKDILGSRNPRSYYRCTHKNELGCQAIKYVQRCDEEPLIFEVTYKGNHSCQSIHQQYPAWPFSFSDLIGGLPMDGVVPSTSTILDVPSSGPSRFGFNPNPSMELPRVHQQDCPAKPDDGNPSQQTVFDVSRLARDTIDSSNLYQMLMAKVRTPGENDLSSTLTDDDPPSHGDLKRTRLQNDPVMEQVRSTVSETNSEQIDKSTQLHIHNIDGEQNQMIPISVQLDGQVSQRYDSNSSIISDNSRELLGNQTTLTEGGQKTSTKESDPCEQARVSLAMGPMGFLDDMDYDGSSFHSSSTYYC